MNIPTVTHQANEQMTLDVLRAKAMAQIGVYHLAILEQRELPLTLNRNIIMQAKQSLERLDREILKHTNGSSIKFLNKNIEQDKLFDIAMVADLMLRIGTEESSQYGDFLGLLVDTFQKVYYAQNNRRNLHFGKYKALFNLIKGEIQRDVNREKPMIVYTQGELFLRTDSSEPQVKLKG